MNKFRRKIYQYPSPGEGRKIVVGMSGGVDSSMALLLLKKQGWRPIGVSLKLPAWKNKKNHLRENVCCTVESFRIAKKICHKLGVPYYIADVQKDFKREVINYFIFSLKRKQTPNPCVICNRYLKFKKLLDWAKRHRIDYVATGHYAKIRRNSKACKYELLKGKDKNKDQSYSLCFLPQKWLSHIIFPLGDYIKEEVYKLAKKEGFEFFLKTKQSQDFCFIDNKSMPEFLKKEIGQKQGLIMDENHQVLGKHQGLHFYTIGQRKGINLPNGPYFVKGFDIKKNILIATNKPKELLQKKVFLSSFNFISAALPNKAINVQAKIRYRQSLESAILYPVKLGKLKIVFKKSQRAITPGQFCVFYNKNVCLGGGVIN
ncbi:MAG: tRNA 2-thiouridine(34) synthase MnmA [Patescibacteria group bacterium]